MRAGWVVLVVVAVAGCADRIERYEGRLRDCINSDASDRFEDGAATLIVDHVEAPPIVLFAIAPADSVDQASVSRPKQVTETETGLSLSGGAIFSDAAEFPDRFDRVYEIDLVFTGDNVSGTIVNRDPDAAPGEIQTRLECGISLARR